MGVDITMRSIITKPLSVASMVLRLTACGVSFSRWHNGSAKVTHPWNHFVALSLCPVFCRIPFHVHLRLWQHMEMKMKMKMADKYKKKHPSLLIWTCDKRGEKVHLKRTQHTSRADAKDACPTACCSHSLLYRSAFVRGKSNPAIITCPLW